MTGAILGDMIGAPYEFDMGNKTKDFPLFRKGTDFEDVIRTAVSLGGDCDTLTYFAGSMAEAYYGVPAELSEECKKRLTADLLGVLERFESIRK